jgi:hypothetical protein
MEELEWKKRRNERTQVSAGMDNNFTLYTLDRP